MNFADPFDQEFPDVIEDCLQYGNYLISTCKFNATGTLLAAGCSSGHLLIFDFVTRGIAATFHAHPSQIVSLSWSPNGRYIMTCGKSCFNFIVWDILEFKRCFTFDFCYAVFYAEFHPVESYAFLEFAAPMLVSYVSEGLPVTTPLKLPEDCPDDINGATAYFDRKAQAIYLTIVKGPILVLSYPDQTLLQSIPQAQQQIITLEFSRNEKFFITNNSDRAIRLFPTVTASNNATNGQQQATHKYQDTINRIQWTSCTISPDSEYVAASTNDHNIYIWGSNFPTLVKMLEGPKDNILDISWHPCRAMMTCVSAYGLVYVWGKKIEDNWTAFAPGFKTLDHNTVYEEREDEFDIVESNNEDKENDPDLEMDEIVDITGVDHSSVAEYVDFIPVRLDLLPPDEDDMIPVVVKKKKSSNEKEKKKSKPKRIKKKEMDLDVEEF